MTSLMNIALSGMHRNYGGLTTAANNVANVNTRGYRAQRYDAATGTTSPRYETTPRSADTDADAPPASDVDLATEFVDIKLHEIGYRANATVIHVADRLSGEVLDLLA